MIYDQTLAWVVNACVLRAGQRFGGSDERMELIHVLCRSWYEYRPSQHEAAKRDPPNHFGHDFTSIPCLASCSVIQEGQLHSGFVSPVCSHVLMIYNTHHIHEPKAHVVVLLIPATQHRQDQDVPHHVDRFAPSAHDHHESA